MTFRSARIAILGRPNAGKSTLLNALIESDLSATSKRPQTTRMNIRGIRQIMKGKTWQGQWVFVDTPGLNFKKGLLDRYMFSAVEEALKEVDIILWISDLKNLKNDLRDIQMKRPGSDRIPAWLSKGLEDSEASPQKWILVLNKVDLLNVNELLPVIEEVSQSLPLFQAIVPVAAKLGMKNKDSNLSSLSKLLWDLTPEGEAIYKQDRWTDLSERQLLQNLLRESIFRVTKEEVPYFSDASVLEFKEPEGIKRKAEVHATICVSKKSLKPILVGKKGERIKEIGTQVRKRYLDLTGEDLVLKLFVKVVEGWTEEEKFLEELGYVHS